MTRLLLGLPAPAKLNLFLHVTGRRADGYHTVQSVLVPVDLSDVLDFELRDDGAIERTGDVIGEPDHDLALRAARALQQASACRSGVSIHVEKRIPAGSGMGGGSSDAATTLIALNRLWGLRLPRDRLQAIALELGADVPFFLGTGPAFAEGIGERLTPVPVGPSLYAVIHPQVAVSTAEIFNDERLTRDTKPTIIAAFSAAQEHDVAPLFGVNDLEPVARRRYPVVDQAIRHLQRFGPARMTGSGSAVFAPMADAAAARQSIDRLPAGWSGWVVQGLDEHPLAAW